MVGKNTHLFFDFFIDEIRAEGLSEKQSLYLLKVAVRSAYTLLFRDSTCGITLGLLMLMLFIDKTPNSYVELDGKSY